MRIVRKLKGDFKKIPAPLYCANEKNRRYKSFIFASVCISLAKKTIFLSALGAYISQITLKNWQAEKNTKLCNFYLPILLLSLKFADSPYKGNIHKRIISDQKNVFKLVLTETFR